MSDHKRLAHVPRLNEDMSDGGILSPDAYVHPSVITDPSTVINPGVIIDRGVVIEHSGILCPAIVGQKVVIKDTNIVGKGSVQIGKGTTLDECTFDPAGGSIQLGEDCHFTRCHFNGSMQFGSHCTGEKTNFFDGVIHPMGTTIKSGEVSLKDSKHKRETARHHTESHHAHGDGHDHTKKHK
jgi:UDP-3-O-[3-hydroxymyristoyl] glucosamine N-acyltransferase